ncbi:MAG: class I SAM-dependent methyltransferase [Halobacteriota archaeon]|jgi:O-methyltransferase involved in polyketide biosynthesis
MKVHLSNVEETLLIPLWSRAQSSRAHNSLLNDAKAIEIIDQIDYDFSKLARRQILRRDFWFVIRAKQFDDKIQAHIAEHPRATVVNIGAGLDTTFYRIDNGSIRWYDLDLPNVIDIRRRLLPETDRTTSIARSIFDSSWYSEIKQTQKRRVSRLRASYFILMRRRDDSFFVVGRQLPGAEIVFDTLPKLAVTFTNWNVRKAGMKGATVKWALRDANEITKWDNHITVIDQVPLFRNIPRDP